MNQSGEVEATTTVNLSVTENNNSSSTFCVPVNNFPLFFILVYSLLFLVGLVMNGFTLRVYFCRAQQQTSSVTIYLKNLAAADFLLSLCLPIRIVYFASKSAALHKAYCTFVPSTFYLNMYASIMFMGYIAANRYLKIVRPLGNHVLQTVRAAYIISTVTWLVLLVPASTYILVSLITQKDLSTAPSLMSCDSLHSPQMKIFYQIIHIFSVTTFLLVLVSLVFFYYSTSLRLSQMQRRQSASSPTSTSTKLRRSRRNMLLLVSVFCVCFVPYHLVRLPYAFLSGTCPQSQVLYYLKEAAIMVSVLNVCLDPLIYFIFCKAFRAQMTLGGVLTTPQVHGRSSDGWMSSVKITRRPSLSR